jgi:hypothetical protein
MRKMTASGLENIEITLTQMVKPSNMDALFCLTTMEFTCKATRKICCMAIPLSYGPVTFLLMWSMKMVSLKVDSLSKRVTKKIKSGKISNRLVRLLSTKHLSLT